MGHCTCPAGRPAPPRALPSRPPRLGVPTRKPLQPDRHRDIRPRLVRLAFEPPEVDGRHRERAVVQERAHRLDRGPGIATELRRRVPEDVQPGRGQPRRLEVPPEPPVERAAADALRTDSRLPERRFRVHRREILARIGERSQDRCVGRAGQFPPAALATLASVAVEDGLALEAEITGPEADHLGSSAASEDKDQQDRPVTPATHGVGDHREEPTNLIGAEPPGDRGNGPRAFEGIAGVGDEKTHPDREAVEGTETGDPGPDRRRGWHSSRGTDPMGVGENVGRADLIRGRHSEEGPEHAGIALDRAGRARASALLHEERVDRLLPGGRLTGLERGERLRRHRGSPGDGWTPSITQVAADSNTMPGSCGVCAVRPLRCAGAACLRNRNGDAATHGPSLPGAYRRAAKGT